MNIYKDFCAMRDQRRAGEEAPEFTEEQAFRRALDSANASADTFQYRVQPWLLACFGPMIAGDRAERNHRFLEEAIELVQATGCTASEAHQLVDYVFGRPVGEAPQEVGGVMVTLAALCLARGIDMHVAGETELARIWTKVEAIRAKQAAKPKHSPLPAGPAPTAVTFDDWFDQAADAYKAYDREYSREVWNAALSAIEPANRVGLTRPPKAPENRGEPLPKGESPGLLAGPPPGVAFHGYHDADEHFGPTILDLVRDRIDADADDMQPGTIFSVCAAWVCDQDWRVVSRAPLEVELVSPLRLDVTPQACATHLAREVPIRSV